MAVVAHAFTVISPLQQAEHLTGHENLKEMGIGSAIGAVHISSAFGSS